MKVAVGGEIPAFGSTAEFGWRPFQAVITNGRNPVIVLVEDADTSVEVLQRVLDENEHLELSLWSQPIFSVDSVAGDLGWIEYFRAGAPGQPVSDILA